jgi:hypothetical protein
MEVSGQLHAPATSPPGESSPPTHWIRGWVGLRAGLDDVKKGDFLTLPGDRSVGIVRMRTKRLGVFIS